MITTKIEALMADDGYGVRGNLAGVMASRGEHR
jgi:hypothetical protein